MGVLSLFPVQAPTETLGVYPIIQASRQLFVVPVFAATCLSGKLREFTSPKIGARALLSERMSEIILATFVSMAMVCFCSYFSNTFPPEESVTFKIGVMGLKTQ